MTANQKKILVVVPAYNESGNIQKIINEIKSLVLDCDVLVVDDGSSDSTFEEACAATVQVISLALNLGIGGAVQTGLLYARLHEYDVVVQVDGDGQHDPDYIEKLIEPILCDEADLVIGSRFIGPFLGYRSSFFRRIGIGFFANLISFLTGASVTDPTSGFRAMNKEGIGIFSEYYPIDFPEPESIVVAKRNGLRVKEIPVEMRQRLLGKSSIRYCKTLYYMIKVTIAILLDLMKKERTTNR